MRKPYSPEIKQQIISQYLLGCSIREINESTGVSNGTISDCVNNFSSEIEKGTIDAIHDFFKIIRKNGMQSKDAFYGFAVFSVFSKYKLDANKMNSFVESVLLLSKQNELEPEQLVEICKKLSILQSQLDISLDELHVRCKEMLSEKKQLEDHISSLDLQYKKSKTILSGLLEKKGITERQLQKTEQSLDILKKYGLGISDLDSVSDMLQNAKAKNYDVSELIGYLNQDKSLESALQEKQSLLDDILLKIQEFQKEHEEVSLRHENLKLRHDFMLKSVKSVKDLRKNGVSDKDIVSWQQIFFSFGMDPEKFAQSLKDLGDKDKMVSNLDEKKSQLEEDIKQLDMKKTWLENKSSELSAEISNGAEYGKKNLKKIADYTSSQIDKTVTDAQTSINNMVKQNLTQIINTKKQTEDYFSELVLELETLLEKSHQAEHKLGKMESLKPLFDLINGKFDSVTSIIQIITILDALQNKIKNTKSGRYTLVSNIKRLREDLVNLISHA